MITACLRNLLVNLAQNNSIPTRHDMKRLFLLPLMALAMVLGVTAQNNKTPDGAKRQYQVFGVAFYNLENLLDTINNNWNYDLEISPGGARKWNGKKYRQKIGNLARAIASFTTPTTPNGPAFIGVSEIENRTVLEDLVKAVDERLKAEGRKPWNLKIVHHDSPDRRGVDVGALYNERYFKFINVTNTPLVIPDKPNFRTRDQMCVTGRMGADTVSIIVNHWPSRLGGQEQSSPLREAAAATCKHIADSIWALRPNEGMIIMGDLNDDPQDKSCAKVLGAAKKQKGVPEHGFFNPFWSLLDKGIGTLAYNSSWNLFDQIIVSGSLLEGNSGIGNLHFWDAKVLNFDFLKDKEGNRQGYPRRTFASGVFFPDGCSDHFPTEILLRRAMVPKSR